MNFFKKKQPPCENASDDNIESTKWIISIISLLIVSLLTVASVFAYPMCLRILEGGPETKLKNYVQSLKFMDEQFNEVLNTKLKNRLILRAIKEHPEQLEALKKAAIENSFDYNMRIYEDFLPEVTNTVNNPPLLAKYYIADFEKELVQTNMTKSELNNINDNEKLLRLKFSKTESDIFILDEATAYKNFPVNSYKRQLSNVFENYAYMNISSYLAELFDCIYDEDNFSEYDQKKVELIKNIITQIEKLPKEEYEVIYYIPASIQEALNNESATYYNRIMLSQRGVLIACIAGAAILLCFLFAIIVPYGYQKRSKIVKRFNELPLEVIWIISLILSSIPFATMFLGYRAIDAKNNSDSTSEMIFLNKILLGNTTEYFVYAGISAFVCLSLVYLHTCYTKKIFSEGLIKGFFTNSLILNLLYQFFNWIWSKIVVTSSSVVKKSLSKIKKIYEIDLDRDFKKKLILLNIVCIITIFIVAILLNISLILGIITACVFMWSVYNYSYNLLKNIIYIQDFSKKLAQGDFGIQADENLGVFSKTIKNLNCVKISFKNALDEEIKSRNMKTELISNVSHDLKTPLTSIINYSDLLKKEDLNYETQKEYIETIHKKSQRLKILIEDLFEASKASSGNITLNKEKLDIISVFRQTMGELEEKIKSCELDFKINTPPSPVYAIIDGQKMYRVFSNIIGNITKYSLKGTRVYIDAKIDEDSINFEFKNISNYEMNFAANDILERFKRGDESRNTEGSGLGLAIAKSLVELHGGSLSVNVDGDLFKLIIRIKLN